MPAVGRPECIERSAPWTRAGYASRIHKLPKAARSSARPGAVVSRRQLGRLDARRRRAVRRKQLPDLMIRAAPGFAARLL